MLVNGGFESGMEGWGGELSGVDDAVSRSGAKSMRLKADTVPASDPAFLQRFGAKIKPDTEYTLTYYMKTSDVVPTPGKATGPLTGVGCEFHLRGDGWAACPTRSVLGTTEWRKYVTWVNSGPNPHPTAAIRFRMRDCTGTAWIDNVELREKAAEKR